MGHWEKLPSNSERPTPLPAPQQSNNKKTLLDTIKDNVVDYNPCTNDEISRALSSYSDKIKERDNRHLNRMKEIRDEFNHLIKTDKGVPIELLREYAYLEGILGK